VDNGIHFISGLPRAGSTLLAALLRQNPRFHAGMTSPVGALFNAMLRETSQRNEGAVFIDDEVRMRLLRACFEAFYADVHPKKLVFDTNRLWCAKLPALAEHFPAAKVICCVRHISWIMDSVERLVRRNTLDLSALFGFDAGGTVYTRVNRLAATDGMVGFALDALREAFFGEQADRVILVAYQALTRQPAKTLARLYAFIGEPPFDHDFENVGYDAEEFDRALGAPGLHTVGRRVTFVERPTILPPELFARFENDAFWMNPALNGGTVPVILDVE